MKAYTNILIVDDSSTSRMIIQRCIEMTGLKVDIFSFAENGLEAITMIKAGLSVDLVLTDINMPKMDGQTFSRLMQENESTRAIPLVVVSSIASESTDAELTALGVKAVIRKPVSPAKILLALGGIQ